MLELGSFIHDEIIESKNSLGSFIHYEILDFTYLDSMTFSQ